MYLEDLFKTVKINSYVSSISIGKLKNQIEQIRKYEYRNRNECNFIILHLFMQLGEPDKYCNVLDYESKNNISLCIQPKIKNYVFFKTEEDLNNYISNYVDDKEDMYIAICIKDNIIKLENIYDCNAKPEQADVSIESNDIN